MLTTFGKAVRQIRIEKDMRLLDMARALGKSVAYLSAIEVGRKPIPDGHVASIIRALELTPAQGRHLRDAAAKTRKEVRVDHLSEDQRLLMATLARRLDENPDDKTTIDIVALLRNGLNSKSDENPFRRKRAGMIVPATSARALRAYAEHIRTGLVSDDDVPFPIIEVLEHTLLRAFPNFVFDVVEKEFMGENEGMVIPGGMTLMLREDVYEGACRGNGRDRFTACHEFGHFLLHRDIGLARSREDGTPIYQDSEWQADTFAGALMMSQRHLPLFGSARDAADLCVMSGAAAEYQYGIYKKEGMTG